MKLKENQEAFQFNRFFYNSATTMYYAPLFIGVARVLSSFIKKLVSVDECFTLEKLAAWILYCQFLIFMNAT